MECADWRLLFQQQRRKKGLVKGFIRAFRSDLQRRESRGLLAQYITGTDRGIEIGAGEQTFAPVLQTLLTDAYQSHAGHPTLAREFFPAEKIPYPDGTYDFLISEHVLEHVKDPILVLNEWKRVLKTDGIVCLTMPSPDRTFDRLRPITDLEHLLRDHKDNGENSEEDHWSEWQKLVMDQGLAKHYAGISKSDALSRNELHRHVWDLKAFSQLLEFIGFDILQGIPKLQDREDSYMVIARRKTAK